MIIQKDEKWKLFQEKKKNKFWIGFSIIDLSPRTFFKRNFLYSIRTDVKLIHTEGIIKHGIIVDNTIVLAHELHTYNNFSSYAMDVTSNLYIKKANLFLALNENYIFKKSLLKETQSREDTYDHNKRPFSIKDQMIDTSKYFVEHNLK